MVPQWLKCIFGYHTGPIYCRYCGWAEDIWKDSFRKDR